MSNFRISLILWLDYANQCDRKISRSSYSPSWMNSPSLRWKESARLLYNLGVSSFILGRPLPVWLNLSNPFIMMFRSLHILYNQSAVTWQSHVEPHLLSKRKYASMHGLSYLIRIFVRTSAIKSDPFYIGFVYVRPSWSWIRITKITGNMFLD